MQKSPSSPRPGIGRHLWPLPLLVCTAIWVISNSCSSRLHLLMLRSPKTVDWDPLLGYTWNGVHSWSRNVHCCLCSLAYVLVRFNCFKSLQLRAKKLCWDERTRCWSRTSFLIHTPLVWKQRRASLEIFLQWSGCTVMVYLQLFAKITWNRHNASASWLCIRPLYTIWMARSSSSMRAMRSSCRVWRGS